jgi:MoxR-like ATPase
MFLEKMGIYGLKDIEDYILCALITGDPILLVGEIGSAKTFLSRKIAEALGLKFHSYDASKALFEDVIGFPNPDDFKKGEISYINTPISIWDKEFILIDEISRAEPMMQNKWLEIIRERKIMGAKLEKLKYIFGAMNPPEYLGTNYLDKAFAGRFSLIIKVPSIGSMEDKEIIKIMKGDCEEDAPLLNKKEKKKEFKEFKEFIEKCRKDYKDVEKKFGKKIIDYIKLFINECENSKISIDGRRAKMIYRNIISLITVKINKGTFKEKDLYSIFYDTILRSLPFKITGEKYSVEIVHLIHLKVLEKLRGKNQQEKDYHFSYQEYLSDLLNKIDSSVNIETKQKSLCDLILFLSKIFSGKIKVEKDFLSSSARIFFEKILLEKFKSKYRYGRNGIGFSADFLYNFRKYELPDLNSFLDSVAIRLSINEFMKIKDSSSNFEEIFYNYKNFLTIFFKKEVK